MRRTLNSSGTASRLAALEECHLAVDTAPARRTRTPQRHQALYRSRHSAVRHRPLERRRTPRRRSTTAAAGPRRRRTRQRRLRST